MIPRNILILITIILSISIWAAHIWAINATLNLGMGVGPEILIALIFFILIMLAFPSILIIAVCKCTSNFSLGVVWGLTILIYSIMPIQAALDIHKKDMTYELNNELTGKINNPAASWEAFKASAEKANREMDADMLEQLLDRERFDLAQKMLEDGYDIQTYNLAEYLYNSYEKTERVTIRYSRANIIRFLLDNGCSSTSEFKGANALSLTIRYQDNEASQFLLDKGSNIQSAAVLVAAAEVGNLDMMKKILEEASAFLNYPDVYGNTTLLNVIVRSEGNPEAIKLLLEKGADVNQNNSDGITPLYNTIYWGYKKEIILLLLEHGADAKCIVRNGETVLHAAVRRDEEDADLLEMLIQKGADVNHLNAGGYDALYKAVELGKIAFVEALVKAGAIVTRTYPYEKTLLKLADEKEEPYPVIKKYLTAHGAK